LGAAKAWHGQVRRHFVQDVSSAEHAEEVEARTLTEMQAAEKSFSENRSRALDLVFSVVTSTKPLAAHTHILGIKAE
jgi:hypothetical protein